MSEFSELLKGLAAILWPVTALVFLVVYREPLTALLNRIRRAKVLGQEVELAAELEELTLDVKHLEEVSASASKSTSGLTGDAVEEDEIETEVLEEAARSPKVALMILAATVEKELRLLASGVGAETHAKRSTAAEWRRHSLTRNAKVLSPVIGSATADAIHRFHAVRSTIIHGEGVREDDILRAIDLGLAILRIVRSIRPMAKISGSSSGTSSADISTQRS